MKIFDQTQLKKWDEASIHEPKDSIALINKAAEKFAEYIQQNFCHNEPLIIFCGPGNNGADGLALGILLKKKGYKVIIYILQKNGNVEFGHFLNQTIDYQLLEDAKTLEIAHNAIIIDALFGTGLNKPVTGLAKSIIQKLNSLPNLRLSLDIPSGLFADGGNAAISSYKKITVFKAAITLTIEKPKLAFFIEDQVPFYGQWKICTIGLDQTFEDRQPSLVQLIDKNLIQHIFKPRSDFKHKNDFGHLLCVGASVNRFGCLILAAKGALRSGVGLVSIHCPQNIAANIISQMPEAMLQPNLIADYLASITNPNSFNAILIGPGSDTNEASINCLNKLLNQYQQPLVIDADALNIISKNRYLIKKIPSYSILTPHPGELARLLQKKDLSGYHELHLSREFAKTHKIIIVIKRAITFICLPNGQLFINNAPNSGLAKAGSGDVLAGIIGSLLSQGYNPEQAAILGVSLHSQAAKIAAKKSCESMIASDITECLSFVFTNLNKNDQ